MSLTPAERLAQRHRTTRPMPVAVPREGEPALTVIPVSRRSPKRPHVINTAISTEALNMLERLTQHFRRQHGRSWRQNTTLETALAALAKQVGFDDKEFSSQS